MKKIIIGSIAIISFFVALTIFVFAKKFSFNNQNFECEQNNVISYKN